MNTKAVLLAKPEAPLSWYLKLCRDFKHAHNAVFSQESQAVNLTYPEEYGVDILKTKFNSRCQEESMRAVRDVLHPILPYRDFWS